MAHHKSAIKRIAITKRQNERNKHYKTMLKSAIKNVRTSTESGDASEKFKVAVRLLDKLAAKKIIHRNKAANQKSKLSKFIKSLA